MAGEICDHLVELVKTARRLSFTAHTGKRQWMTYRTACVAADLEFGWLIGGSAPTEPNNGDDHGG